MRVRPLRPRYAQRLAGVMVLAGAALYSPAASALTVTTTVADIPMSLSVDGFVEAYYSFVVRQPVTGVSNGRLFASRHNTIAVSGASIGFELRYGDAFAYVAPWFGLTPATIYAGEPEAPTVGLVGPSDASVWRYLREARAGFDLDAWTVEAGLFVSPIGIEGIATKDNWLWSSSWQNFLFPFYHFGARTTYALPDGHTLALWVVNGFSGAVDVNDGKSIIVTAGGPVGDGAWQVLYYGGHERPDEVEAPDPDLGVSWLHHLDAWISIPVADGVEVAGQGDVGFEPNDVGTPWYVAGSIYGRFSFSDHVALAVRGEAFYEETVGDGDRATRGFFLARPAQSVWVAAGSVAIEVRPVANTAVRLEYRHDRSDDVIFYDNFDEPSRKVQDAVTLGLTAWL